jgi:hypothetical protein
VKTFQKRPSAQEIHGLRDYLDQNAKTINQINIMTLLHRCGKYKVNVFDILGEGTVCRALSSEQGSAQGIANSMYGLQSMKSDNLAALSIIRVLILQIEGCREVFYGQAFANALYGLKGMSSSAKEVRLILAALHRQIIRQNSIESSLRGTSCKVQLSPQGLGSAMLGLQLMSSGVKEVKQILALVTDSIRHCPKPLDPQAVANILIGLKTMSSADREVRLLLGALVNSLSLRGGKGEMMPIMRRASSREISMALWGMQGLSTEYQEVRDILAVLTDAVLYNTGRESGDKDVHPSTVKYISVLQSGDELGLALAGMRRMSSEHKEVRELLGAITASFKYAANGSVVPFKNEQNIANCLYGMQRMNPDSSEIKGFLNLLQKSINAYEGHLGGRAIASAIFGMQCMSYETDEVRSLLRAITRSINKSGEDYTGQHIAMLCYGLQNMSSCCKEVDVLLRTIIPRIEASSSATVNSFSTAYLASSLYGLQCMGADSPTVRRLLRQLTKQALLFVPTETKAGRIPVLSGQEMAMALHGLRNMGSEWVEIQELLRALALLLPPSQEDAMTKGCEFATAIAGLQRMGGGRPLPKPAAVRSVKYPNTDASKSSDIIELSLLMSKNGDGSNASRRRFKAPDALLDFIDALARRMESRSERLSPQDVAAALHGLQGMPAEYVGIRRILGILGEDLWASIPPPSSQPAQTFAMRKPLAVVDSATNRNITAALSLSELDTSMPKLSADRTPLDSRGIGSALFGFQNMTLGRVGGQQMRLCLSALADHIEASNLSINAQALGNSFYGLQGMSSDNEVVQRILCALTNKVDKMPSLQEGGLEYELSGQNIGNALWGFRNMSAESVEVRAALRSIARKIKISTAKMNGQNIGNALYSLHAMDPRHQEVRDVLSAIAIKLMNTQHVLSGLDIGMALYGLRNMDSTVAEVRVILGLLVYRIRATPSSELALQHGDLALAVVGLLGTNEWIRDDFLSVLAFKTKGMTLVR